MHRHRLRGRDRVRDEQRSSNFVNNSHLVVSFCVFVLGFGYLMKMAAVVDNIVSTQLVRISRLILQWTSQCEGLEEQAITTAQHLWVCYCGYAAAAMGVCALF